MPDWKSRLAVMYDVDGTESKITPIDSFQPSFSLNAEALHSIEDTHIGVVFMPEQITFSMTVKAIGTATAELTKLAMEGTAFDITLQEADEALERNGEPQWSLSEVLLADCYITNATPTSASTSGAPTATFSGFALGSSVKGDGTAKVGNKA